jgi:hypothetical protein
MKKLSEVDLLSSFRKWRRGSGPFRCFFRSTNFVSLRHYPDFTLGVIPPGPPASYGAVEEIISETDGPIICVLDLPGAESMRIAAFLQNRRRLKAILTFNSPLHPRGLVGGEEYIGALLGLADSLEYDGEPPRGYVIVLDRDRYGDYGDDDFKRFFNNQYELIDEDLPSVEMLRDLGFPQVLFITSGEVKEDAAAWLGYLSEHGFPVAVNNLEEVLLYGAR